MKKDLSIYVHIPFCVRKCIYCDFVSFPGCPETEKIRYVSALNEEIRLVQPFSDRYIVRTIYLGGGTPSLLDESLIESILKTIRDVFEVDRFAEITIEANPGTMKYASLLKYRSYGINRISIGMQSGDDRLLKMLGRIHTDQQFRESFQMARRAGFRNISVDLMSGLPEQSIHTYAESIRELTELHPEHISSYSLQVEEGTPLYQNQALLSHMPDERTDRRMYQMTKTLLQAEGYQRYEISNYSLPGYESRHNSVYWTGGEYLGFGISAASLFRGERFTNTRDLSTYLTVLEAAREGGHMDSPDRMKLYEETTRQLHTESVTLDRNMRMEEFMFLGLRMTKGVSRQEFQNRFGNEIFEIYGPVIQKYTASGHMDYDDRFVWLTDAGIDVSNYILADFLLDKS